MYQPFLMGGASFQWLNYLSFNENKFTIMPEIEFSRYILIIMKIKKC